MTMANGDADVGRLIVQGADRPGIVARVSSVLSEHGANIVSLAQSSSDPMLARSEEHTSELQSHVNLVCRLLLEKKKAGAALAVDRDDFARTITKTIESHP